jgi:3-deoxy-D-manno-octulosonate 8-phosphate phosphatase KdsC-like HAD superfamily phosphatase
MYIGDSPNDSPMFGYFPLSVGVRSVLKYRDIIDNHPVYVTDGDGSQGFVELVDYIISTK